ncbi:MAG TPA: DMT family transporter [Anaerolineales bacterium]|nr:DMT family transporter [Anaerolineales bacterium]HNA88512.1 DMT family transporter [Anaerolineales bacterium]HNB36519.1 DMT family transporter [Anaerolineales bacterium]HNC08660.1 DMT family transporter [Anaerolineales bacterium]
MKRLTGILLIAISAASFGTLAIFGRYAYTEDIDTFTLLFLRFGISASFMIVMLVLRKEAFPRGRVLAQLIGMGGIGYAGQSFLYLTAIKYASAGLVALLLYLYPFFVAILSMIFLKEKLTRTKALALMLALFGTALTVGPVSGQLIGAVMAIVAALGYSIYIIVGANVMKHVSPFQSSTVIFTSASIVYGMLTLSNGIHLPHTNFGWLVIAGIVIVSTIIPVTSFLAGLERIGPTNAAMLSTVEPIVTVFLATLLFGDQLAPIVLLGGAFILIAVILLTRTELRSTSAEGI